MENKEAFLNYYSNSTSQFANRKSDILSQAKTIVDGLRGDDYYDPVKNFRDISVLASIMTRKELTPEDCCKVLMAVKLTREAFKHKEDNLIDLAGYTYILEKLNQ